MNYGILRTLLAFCVVWVIGFGQPVQSQDIGPQNLSNLNVDALTDDQIGSLISKLEESGYSQQQLELLARSRGMSSLQIQKLRRRIEAVNSGINDGISSPTGRDFRLRSSTTSPTLLPENQTLDPFAELLPNDTTESPYDLPIAGLKFFKNSRLSFEPSMNVPTPENYLVGPGDELIVDVWGASEETYQLTISPEGAVRIPGLGVIYLNGFNVKEVREKIVNSLKRIYSTIGRGTTVEVSLGQLRTITVNVIGAVEVPGTYNMSSFATAFTALYMAGGPTFMGSLRQIDVFRKGRKVGTLDAYDFFMRGNQTSNVELRDQDVVLVRPYLNRVFVYGEVKRPAVYELLAGETLEDLFLYSGGFTEEAYKNRLSVRRNAENFKTVITVEAESFDKLVMESGDRIDVSKIAERYEGRITIKGAVNNPGEFQFEEGMMLSNALEYADGFRGDASWNGL